MLERGNCIRDSCQSTGKQWDRLSAVQFPCKTSPGTPGKMAVPLLMQRYPLQLGNAVKGGSSSFHHLKTRPFLKSDCRRCNKAQRWLGERCARKPLD